MRPTSAGVVSDNIFTELYGLYLTSNLGSLLAIRFRRLQFHPAPERDVLSVTTSIPSYTGFACHRDPRPLPVTWFRRRHFDLAFMRDVLSGTTPLPNITSPLAVLLLVRRPVAWLGSRGPPGTGIHTLRVRRYRQTARACAGIIFSRLDYCRLRPVDSVGDCSWQQHARSVHWH